jgi:nicotinamidase-related amidase
MLTVQGKEIFTTIGELVDPRYTALLLIDIQNDYIAPGGYFDKMGNDLSAVRQLVPRVKSVLEAARRSNVLVVHVRKTLYPDLLAESPCNLRSRLVRLGDDSTDYSKKLLPYCIDGTWGWRTVEDLSPLTNEVVVRKHNTSAFASTTLPVILKSNDIKSVVISGLATNGCVLATALDAPCNGYYAVVLSDCVASTRGVLHDAALSIMSQCIDVVNSGQVLDVWK